MAAERPGVDGALDDVHLLAITLQWLRLDPAFVDGGRNGDGVQFRDVRLHIVEPVRVDAVERAERALPAFADKRRILQVGFRAHVQVGPIFFGSDAVMEPAFEGATQ